MSKLESYNYKKANDYISPAIILLINKWDYDRFKLEEQKFFIFSICTPVSANTSVYIPFIYQDRQVIIQC